MSILRILLLLIISSVAMCVFVGCDKRAPCAAQENCLADASSGESVPDTARTERNATGEQKECEKGTKGCRCLSTGTCDKGLRCESGTCRSCAEGTAGCACAKGIVCIKGLTCQSGICGGCAGKAGCPCYGNHRCDKGNRCTLGADGSNRCESCKGRGSQGCQCAEDNDCDSSLICLHLRCTPPVALGSIPKAPKCYQPCEGDIRQSDGTLLKCDAQTRLMPGCLPGFSCVGGSCVQTGQSLRASAYPFCLKPADCPSWQTCVSGRCYSTCRAATDCAKDFACHAFVCRRQCDTKKPECDREQTCQNIGSTEGKGLCMPLVTRKDATSRSRTREVFTLSASRLSLDQSDRVGLFAIVNDSPFTSRIHIAPLSDNTGTTKPLSWLRFERCKSYKDANRTECQTFDTKAGTQGSLALEIAAKEKVIVRILGVEKAGKGFEGILQVKSSETTQELAIQYRQSGTGHWQGKLYSFGNFDDTKIDSLREQNATLLTFKNALLRRWLNFKKKTISYDQFAAALLSIRTGTWRQDKTKADCRTLFSSVGSSDIACYPSSSSKGYDILSISLREAPVPTAVSSMDFAMNVKDLSGVWEGRVDSGETLHIPGYPHVKIALAGTAGSNAFQSVNSLQLKADLGGRYAVRANEQCANATRMQRDAIPWLIPGFVAGTTARPGSLFRDTYACLHHHIPLTAPPGADALQKRLIRSQNASLSAANPIPNGRTLRRSIELIDGALLQNRVFFAIVRERFTSPFPKQNGQTSGATDISDWSRYGYLWLTHTRSDVSDADTQGNQVPICQSKADCSATANETCEDGVCQPPPLIQQVQCSPHIVQLAMNQTIALHKELQQWSTQQLTDLIDTLRGNQTQSTRSNKALYIEQSGTNQRIEYSHVQNNTRLYIHYYCEDTRQFNGGPIDSPQDCPLSSKVIFFENNVSENTMRSHPCHRAGNCNLHMLQMRTSSPFRENIPFKCKQDSAKFCDDNRKDLREGKIFFKQSTKATAFVSTLAPLRAALFEAFRYRMKFQNRTGTNVGFTPVACSEVANSQTPYCYNPKVIEELEQRVNCLEALYTDEQVYKKLSTATKVSLKEFLKQAFAFSNRRVGSRVVTDPGFETLNAELKVMLGDEAYVQSLSSRYELNNARLVAFEGSRFEPNGIDLSGALGYEMYNLYLSTQYYQMVLDRFYAQANVFLTSFQTPTRSFFTSKSLGSLLPKLLLAMTRKTRNWSQIAKKYHAMNRLDLARGVLERAYVSSTIEQMLMTQLLRHMSKVVSLAEQTELRAHIERTTLTFQSALLDMQNTYKRVSQRLNLFGFGEDFVPFPARGRSVTGAVAIDAFRFVLNFAKERANTAQRKEQLAVQARRDFDADAARFQSELVQISNNYNEQLIRICGEIKQGNQTLPAISKYAQLSPAGTRGSNPCGRDPGSQLHQAYLELEQVALSRKVLEHQQKTINEAIKSEEVRIKKYCNDQFSLSNITWKFQDENRNLNLRKSKLDIVFKQVSRALLGGVQVAVGWKCEVLFGGAIGTSCIGAAAANVARIAVLAAEVATTTALSLELQKLKSEALAIQRDFARTSVRTACNVCPADQPDCKTQGVARIQSQDRIAQLTLSLLSFALRARTAEYDMRLAINRIVTLERKVQRLVQEQEEVLALQISTQAAQNDPNVRIYKNDAIINAERTFEDAMREAYRATLVFEYYTGQTYVNKGDLYLIRMISRGDKNLEAYLSQLEQAFRDFEERNKKPDFQVLVLSLRDDILKIPRVDQKGVTLGLQQRTLLLQKALLDPSNYDARGYFQANFSIHVDEKSPYVSPATYNHKIEHIEVEVKATQRGDHIGRVYLRQGGTGMVRVGKEQIRYYPLPAQLSVINVFFNGHKTFEPTIYNSYRLLDRPLGNTQWTLLFNQVTEQDNQDIDLNSVNDIVVYMYYTDFTLP